MHARRHSTLALDTAKPGEWQPLDRLGLQKRQLLRELLQLLREKRNPHARLLPEFADVLDDIARREREDMAAGAGERQPAMPGTEEGSVLSEDDGSMEEEMPDT